MNSLDLKIPTICKSFRQKRQKPFVSMLVLALGIIFGVYSLYTYKRLNIPKELYKDDISAYKTLMFIYHTSLILSLWYFIHFTILVSTLCMVDGDEKIYFNYLLFRRFSLSFLFCIILYPFIIHIGIINRIENILDDPNDKYDVSKNILFDYTVLQMPEKNFYSWINGVKILFGAYLIHDFIIYYLKLYFYYNTFKERFEEKEEYAKILQKIYLYSLVDRSIPEVNKNEIKNIHHQWLRNKELDVISEIYDYFKSLNIPRAINAYSSDEESSDDSKSEGFKSYLLPAELKKLDNLLYDDENKDLTKESFVTKFKIIFKEANNILDIFCKSNKQLSSLKAVTIPLIMYFVLSYFLSNTKTGASGVLGSFFSLYFIIGPGLSDLFRNLITLHLTKPFDIGNLISIDNELYFVRHIGFFFTELENNTGSFMHSNLLFKKRMIGKSKDNRTHRQTLQISFTNLSKCTEIASTVSRFISNHSQDYTSYCKIYDISMKDNIHTTKLDFDLLYEDLHLSYIVMKRDNLINALLNESDKLEIRSVELACDIDPIKV